jgi:hypothetical protein
MLMVFRRFSPTSRDDYLGDFYLKTTKQNINDWRQNNWTKLG